MRTVKHEICKTMIFQILRMYGISKNLNTNTDYVLHNLVDSDSLDSLALKYYGRPDLF